MRYPSRLTGSGKVRLAVAATLAVAVIAIELLHTPTIDAVLADEPVQPTEAAPTGEPADLEERAAQVSERPLFRPSRKAGVATRPGDLSGATPVVQVAAPPPPSVADCVVLGILIGPDRPSAIIKPDHTASSIIVHEGDSLKGWQVMHIRSKFVELLYDETKRELYFPKQGRTPG